MTRLTSIRLTCSRVTSVLAAGLMAGAIAAPARADSGENVIELTQVACQFLESENGVDHDFTTQGKADCQRINAKTAEERLDEARVMTLEPGTYTFRVTNKDVPYTLGFWIREAGYQPGNAVDKLTKTSVSGGGLDQGETKDYTVKLEPGEYRYSCPLNPTPNYKLVVEG
jgi:hypothetical protein